MRPDATGRPGKPPRWSHRIAGYCLRHGRVVAAVLGSAILAQVLAVAIPLVVREAVDGFFGQTVAAGTGWAALLAVLALAVFAVNVLNAYVTGRLALDVAHDLRRDAFAALVRSNGGGQERPDAADVISRVTGDLTQIQGALASVPILAANMLLFVLAFAVMAVLSPILSLVAVIMGPVLWYVTHRAASQLYPANWAAAQCAAEVVGKVEAAVSGAVVVKAFTQEDRELRELRDKAGRLFAQRMRVARIQGRYTSALQAMPWIWQAMMLLAGGWMALSGTLSIGTFLAFFVYLSMLVGPVRGLTPMLAVVQRARAGAERVLALIDTPVALTEPTDPVALPPGPLDIEFRNVSFGYGDGPPVLNGLSMRVAAGETAAIVGASGSGKSTLIALLGRFHDPDAGEILLGGVDIRRVPLDALRARLGLGFEDAFLFDDSIRANITYAVPDAEDAKVRAVASTAAADGFIASLPQGYQTVVGERGRRLSGGQRQRIALARALLPAPSVLVLDDVTSAVDPLTEARIHAALDRAVTGTVLLVARRRASLALADRVIVLDRGRVVDFGPPAIVEQRCPQLRALFPSPPFDGDDDAHHHGGPDASTGAAPMPAPPAQTEDAEILVRVGALPPAGEPPRVPDALAFAPVTRLTLPGLLRPVLGLLTWGLMLVCLETAARVATPALVRAGMDNGVIADSRRVLMVVSLAILGAAALSWIVGLAGALITARAGERLLYLLRVRMFAHLQRLGLDFYDREPTGQIMTRMTTDIDALSDFLRGGVPLALVSAMMVLGALIALAAIDPVTTLVLLAALPVIALATALYRVVAVPVYRDARRHAGTLNSLLYETAEGLRVAQACRRVGHHEQRYAAASREYRDRRLRAHVQISLYLEFIRLLSGLARAAVLIVGAVRLADGDISAGALVAFFLYLDLFFTPVQDLSQIMDRYRQATVGLNHLRDLMRIPVSPPVTAAGQPAGRLVGQVRLCDIWFTYPDAAASGDRPALTGINLTLRAGETVALVGCTGSGKSTLVKLVARFYDPTAGSILIEGQDLRKLDLLDHRRRLGVVPQEPYLSAGTVRDAIAYGRPEATDAEVEAAARAVGAHLMITGLSGGYRHPVAPRGRNLSAGQRQLLGLARAELVAPDILLLDEATGSLDAAAEAAVIAAMGRLARDRTTLVIAHRLATAARADRVVVLDEGRIVETGRHEELVTAGGRYAALWTMHVHGEARNDSKSTADMEREATWLTPRS